MVNKKTAIIFTDEQNAESAQAVKDYLSLNKNNLAILIGSDEFLGIAARLIKSRLFAEDGAVQRFSDRRQRAKQDRLTDKRPAEDIRFISNHPVHIKAQNILLRYTPDLIILNDTSAMQTVLAARAKVCPDVPVVMLMNSYVLNKQYIHPAIDIYFVDNMGIKTTLVNEGIAEERVLLTDLPLSLRFGAEIDKAAVLAEYSFSADKPTVLVAVPSVDASNIRPALDILSGYAERVNLVVDCGTDRELLVYARDRKILAVNEGKESAPLYALADVVISRPVTTTLAKAFASGKLFFALEAKGEGEKRTAEYLFDRLVKTYTAERLTIAMDTFLEKRDAYSDILESVTAHNQSRPRGVLFKELELLLDKK